MTDLTATDVEGKAILLCDTIGAPLARAVAAP